MKPVRVFPLWLKLIYTGWLSIQIPFYVVFYPLQNFLWFSNVALLSGVVALWLELRLLASMMALAVAVPEIAWNIGFFGKLLTGHDIFGLAEYMFHEEKPLFIRGLSLYHVFLPVVLLFMVHRLGYDRRALPAQTLLAWVVLPLSYFLADLQDPRTDNINWVFGWGAEKQLVRNPWHLGMVMLLMPLLVYAPTHFILKRLFPGRQPSSTA